MIQCWTEGFLLCETASFISIKFDQGRVEGYGFPLMLYFSGNYGAFVPLRIRIAVSSPEEYVVGRFVGEGRYVVDAVRVLYNS
jgi:hypothetical protein